MTRSPLLRRVDCHVLWLPGQRIDWWQQCRLSLSGEPVNVFELEGIPWNYPRARCSAFHVGSAPFVSFVDPDDYVLPGAFDQCLRLLDVTGAAAVYTDSLRVWEDDPPATGTVSTPRRPHQLIVARRDAVEKATEGEPVSDSELWRRVGELGKVLHLPVVGYVWREHRMTRMQEYSRWFAAH